MLSNTPELDYRAVTVADREFTVGFDLEDSNDAPFGNAVIYTVELELRGMTRTVTALLSTHAFSAIQTALDNLLWEEFDENASYHAKAYWHDNPAAAYY